LAVSIFIKAKEKLMEKLIDSIKDTCYSLENSQKQKIVDKVNFGLKLMQSISTVKEDLKKYASIEKEREELSVRKIEKENLIFIASIDEILSKLKQFKIDQERIEQQSTIHEQDFIASIKNISNMIQESKNRDVEHFVSKESLFSFLDKASDENFHSDYIAALLNKEFMGAFSEKLFESLLKKTSSSTEEISTRRLHTYRERRLDTLNENLKNAKGKLESIGARRIDILSVSTSHIIIIENKIYSCEHGDQTIDYYKATEVYCNNLSGHQKKIIAGIMLSPAGIKAAHSMFTSLTYTDLFFILKELRPCVEENHALIFLDIYLDSLYLHFFHKDKTYSDFLLTFWRNYDVKLKAI
jgi:hypothetical protein